MKQKFFICEHCGNIITLVEDKGVPVVCCGQKMTELVPGSVDAAVEKHVPVVTVNGNIVTVSVGSTPHPMAEEHYITWVAVETKHGFQIRHLLPGESTTANFAVVPGDKLVTAYAYCNLHGLWKADIE